MDASSNSNYSSNYKLPSKRFEIMSTVVAFFYSPLMRDAILYHVSIVSTDDL